MKNSKNKIIAAVICGAVLGSVGTSIIGNFQNKAEQVSYTAANENSSKVTSQDSNTSGSSVENTPVRQGKGQRDGKGGGHHKGEASLDSTESVDVSNGNYADGVYTGCADGYAKNLNVQVEIAGGKISDIQVTSHNETPGFYEKAFELVPAAIIEKQSTDVDTTSGATYSSMGIINAVNDALSDAQS